jgi:predicted TIM-barrel fold metal-dependent hydrolase
MAPVVDSHLHIWSDNVEKYPRTEVPYPGSAELLLEYMEEAGVDHSVFVLSLHYQYDNRFIVDTLEKYEGKFAGIGVIDPRGAAAAVELERLVGETKVRGVRLRGPIEEDVFCQPECEPLWSKAQELGAPLCILCKPEQVAALDVMIEKYPETNVVIDHFAMIAVADGIDSAPFRSLMGLARFPNVYLKVSGMYYWADRYPFPQAQQHLKAAYEAFGPQRLMWGSDWPHVLFGNGYVRCINFVRRDLEWLSEDDKEHILGGTAYRLFWD